MTRETDGPVDDFQALLSALEQTGDADPWPNGSAILRRLRAQGVELASLDSLMVVFCQMGMSTGQAQSIAFQAIAAYRDRPIEHRQGGAALESTGRTERS
jgi:hypothetical protein